MAYSAYCDTSVATKWWITGTGSVVNRLSEVMDDNPAGVEEDDNLGNFQPWATFMTEHIEDFDYQIHLSFDVGDGTTPTTLVSKNGEHVHGDDGAFFANKANTTLQLGSLAAGNSAVGVFWNFQIVNSWSAETFCHPGSILKVYGSVIVIRDFTANMSIHETEIKQSMFLCNLNAYITFYSASTDISGQVYFFRGIFRLDESPSNVEDIHCHYMCFGIYAKNTGKTITVKNMRFTNTLDADVVAGGTSGSNLNVVNPISNIGTVIISTVEDAWIKEQYTFNLHVKDKDGANLQSVTCLLEDKDDTQVFSVQTAADGTITEQTVTYKKWEGTDETLTEYSPHKLTLSKANYETIVIDNITMDELKDWEFELLPTLAVGDVRDGTSFGEDKEGTLDLPAVGDVEKLVKFDNETKTGTFVVPVESDVRLAGEYGDSAEFVGTLDLPSIDDVRDETKFDNETKTGVMDLPVVRDVEKDVKFDNETKTGTFEAPAVTDVEKDVGYGANGTEFKGTFKVPPENNVNYGISYGADGEEFNGSLDAPIIPTIRPTNLRPYRQTSEISLSSITNGYICLDCIPYSLTDLILRRNGIIQDLDKYEVHIIDSTGCIAIDWRDTLLGVDFEDILLMDYFLEVEE